MEYVGLRLVYIAQNRFQSRVSARALILHVSTLKIINLVVIKFAVVYSSFFTLKQGRWPSL
jgi:hypothetical protein